MGGKEESERRNKGKKKEGEKYASMYVYVCVYIYIYIWIMDADTYSLEDLLAPDVLQARVEVLDALRDILQLALVTALDLARLADGQVQRQLDAAVGARGVQPVLAAAVAARREAEAVVASLVRREVNRPDEEPRCDTTRWVVVEDFLLRRVSLV